MERHTYRVTVTLTIDTDEDGREYDRAVADEALLPEGVTTGEVEAIRAAFRKGLSDFVKRHMKGDV